jgi:hypothetical protein
MNFDTDIKDIKKLVAVLTGKDADVSITYKGTAYGVTKPWLIRCDSREITHESHEGGAAELVKSLREELVKKISDTKKQAAEYEKALGALEN